MSTSNLLPPVDPTPILIGVGLSLAAIVYAVNNPGSKDDLPTKEQLGSRAHYLDMLK